MKSLLLLAALAVCAPALRAQEIAPIKNELAQIDPVARDLLARVQSRYQKFESFESLIEWKIGAAGAGLEPRRFRVQMTRDAEFVVGEEFPDKSWGKWICDGKTLVEFSSQSPGIYTRTNVKSPVYLGLLPQLEANLRSVNAEGPLISLLLTNDFGRPLLSPDFAGLTLSEAAPFQIVTFLSRAPKDHPQAGAIGEVKLWIDPTTLTLDRASILEDGAEVFTESYSQTRFNPTFDPKMFRAAAPLNYKLVNYFPYEVSTATNPPVDFAR